MSTDKDPDAKYYSVQAVHRAIEETLEEAGVSIAIGELTLGDWFRAIESALADQSMALTKLKGLAEKVLASRKIRRLEFKRNGAGAMTGADLFESP